MPSLFTSGTTSLRFQAKSEFRKLLSVGPSGGGSTATAKQGATRTTMEEQWDVGMASRIVRKPSSTTSRILRTPLEAAKHMIRTCLRQTGAKHSLVFEKRQFTQVWP